VLPKSSGSEQNQKRLDHRRYASPSVLDQSIDSSCEAIAYGSSADRFSQLGGTFKSAPQGSASDTLGDPRLAPPVAAPPTTAVWGFGPTFVFPIGADKTLTRQVLDRTSLRLSRRRTCVILLDERT